MEAVAKGTHRPIRAYQTVTAKRGKLQIVYAAALCRTRTADTVAIEVFEGAHQNETMTLTVRMTKTKERLASSPCVFLPTRHDHPGERSRGSVTS